MNDNVNNNVNGDENENKNKINNTLKNINYYVNNIIDCLHWHWFDDCPFGYWFSLWCNYRW